jgi:hypothetical protein
MTIRTKALALVFALLVPIGTLGFFNDLDELQTELIAWQAEHDTDFSDLLETIKKISPTLFTDMEDTDWFHPYVAALSSWGLVSGLKDAKGNPTGQFEPGRSVTLAETLKISMEAAGIDKNTCGRGLKHAQAQNHWAKDYVVCAEKLDVSLFDGKQPDLNRTISRAEALSVMSDTFQDPLLQIGSMFDDTVGHPMELYIANAAALGIVSGDRNADGTLTGKFRPNDQISRAEISKMVFDRLKIKAAQLLSFK